MTQNPHPSTFSKSTSDSFLIAGSVVALVGSILLYLAYGPWTESSALKGACLVVVAGLIYLWSGMAYKTVFEISDDNSTLTKHQIGVRPIRKELIIHCPEVSQLTKVKEISEDGPEFDTISLVLNLRDGNQVALSTGSSDEYDLFFESWISKRVFPGLELASMTKD